MKLMCVAFALLAAVGILRVQQWGPAELRFPMLDRVPSSVYMPYNVLLGYVALDSIYYWLRYRAFWADSTPYWRTNMQRLQELTGFIKRRRQWDDTLRKIVRVLYAMSDYDPILFARTLRMNPPHQPWYRHLSSGNFPQPDEFAELLLGLAYDDEFDMGREHLGVRRYSMQFWNAYGQDTLDRIRDLLLLQSFYIAHIKVVDTMTVQWGHTPRFVVTAQVLDLIKGQQLMPCDARWMHPRLSGWGGESGERVFRPWLRSGLESALERKEHTGAGEPLSGSPACLQFCAAPVPYVESWYSDDIRLGVRGFGDTVQVGREYLVFLTFSFWEMYPGGSIGPRSLPDTLQLVTIPFFTSPPLPQEPPPPPVQWEWEYEYDKFGQSLFPIEYRDGEAVVRMPENDLWLGQEVPLAWFKAWLRERIAQYRSW